MEDILKCNIYLLYYYHESIDEKIPIFILIANLLKKGD